MASYTFTLRVVFASHHPWVCSFLLTANSLLPEWQSGMLIPVNYSQIMCFLLVRAPKIPHHLLGVNPIYQLINSILVKIINLKSHWDYPFIFSYSRKHAYLFWCQIHTSLLGIVVPMDTHFFIVVEWVGWDGDFSWSYLAFFSELTAELFHCHCNFLGQQSKHQNIKLNEIRIFFCQPAFC